MFERVRGEFTGNKGMMSEVQVYWDKVEWVCQTGDWEETEGLCRVEAGI